MHAIYFMAFLDDYRPVSAVWQSLNWFRFDRSNSRSDNAHRWLLRILRAMTAPFHYNDNTRTRTQYTAAWEMLCSRTSLKCTAEYVSRTRVGLCNRVFTRSSKLSAKFQQTSSKHPAGLMEPRPYQPISCLPRRLLAVG